MLFDLDHAVEGAPAHLLAAGVADRVYSAFPKVMKKADGYLGIYQRDVQPMSTGAVLVD